MFKFKPTKKTYTDPVAATFIPGIPFGRAYSKGDICLLNDGFQGSKIFLNSKILREAILNSKDFLEEILNISIKDKAPVVKEAPKDMEVIEAPVTKAKNTSKGKGKTKDLIIDSESLESIEASDVIIEGVDEIPEGAEVIEGVTIEAPAEVADAIEDAIEG